MTKRRMAFILAAMLTLTCAFDGKALAASVEPEDAAVAVEVQQEETVSEEVTEEVTEEVADEEPEVTDDAEVVTEDTTETTAAEEEPEVIEEETGKTIDEIYSEFRDEPLGSASIGQAHYGVLKDGTRVVTKVQRPGIADMMREDFVLLKKLAGMVSMSAEDDDESGALNAKATC